MAPEDLLTRAKEWVLSATDADLVKPWDAKGYKMPGGAPYHPAGFRPLSAPPPWCMARRWASIRRPRRCSSAVYEGALVPFDTALKIEARHFTSRPDEPVLLRDDPLPLHQQGSAGEGREPAQGADQTVKKLGVIGAGMMGAGIAYVAANAGIEVVLIDADARGRRPRQGPFRRPPRQGHRSAAR